MHRTTLALIAIVTTVLTTASIVAFATTLILIVPVASAQNSRVVPCMIGNGNDQLCDSCNESKAIEVTPWENATWVSNFTMGTAVSDTGPGYKVFWKVEQPAGDCRILLFDSFNSEKGSIEPKLSGRIGLSVNKGGCYMSTVRSGGVGAGACCGTDCVSIGAFPGTSTAKRDDVSGPANKAMRFEVASENRLLSIGDSDEYRNLHAQDKINAIRHRHPREMAVRPNDENRHVRRASGDQHPNPWAGGPAPPPAKWNCKAEQSSGTYTKSGKQVVDGNAFLCGSDIGCDMSVDFQASVASSVSSEKTTTYTNSEGMTHEAMIGWMMAGPSVTYTFSYNKEFSEAVASSTGTSNTDTKSRGVTFRQQVTPGFQYNSWWAPTLSCQTWTLSCDQGKGPIEKCDPLLDANGNPVGEQGIMTTGRA